MKKFILSTMMAFSFMAISHAQIWIDTGLKGGGGLNFLVNNNIFDDNSYSHLLSGSYGVGAKAGVNFGEYHGFTIDAMYRNMKQNFNYTVDMTDYTNTLEWTNWDMYFMYRFNTGAGTYLELGPMLSLVQEFKQADTGFSEANISDYYTDRYLNGVFGVGGYLAGSDAFSLIIGLRIHYGLDDLISEAGQAKGYPNPFKSVAAYDTYTPTNQAYVEMGLELNWGIGYFAKTTCGGRRKFIGN